VHANRRDISPAVRAAAITQPEIRRVVERYLSATASVVRPKTIAGRAASLATFTEWLSEAHPEVSSLGELTRAHLEEFLIFDDHVRGAAVSHATPRSRSATTPAR